jgi:hypothetical protein
MTEVILLSTIIDNDIYKWIYMVINHANDKHIP